MLHPSATDTFFVKMLVAVAALAYVLKDVAKVVRAAELLHTVIVAQLCQLPIDTAFSAFFVTIEELAKLFCGKLLIGMGGQKIDQSHPPCGVVGFLLHKSSF